MALAIAGCGGAGSGAGSGSTASTPRSAGAFAWLSPAAAPAGWSVGRLPSGQASVAYPPGWRAIKTDPGTFSAALMGANGKIRGYLNATPRQGAETFANWAHFRTDHNKDEGDFNLVSDASATGLRFRTGSGSCVIDHYATVRAHYREIACLVHGSRADTVVVGATLPGDWSRLGPQVERAISSFVT
ncbi:MAG TPA: hypothetical protein VH817_14865 [Thermoleophilaceae bacterium]